ncbi:hypothetical protein KAW50_08510, partial [candidate division WOR-3 bacterium]|nr:hypothetical protein [candidate division WOR-3 bacterium]
MKKLYLFTVIIVVSFLSTEIAQGLDLKALQDTLRKLGNPWAAGTTSVSELPIEQKRKLCSLMLSPSSAIPKEKIGLSSLPKDSLPSEWDWRDVNGHNWMTAFHYPSDGGIWTFPWIEAMESRVKIVNNTPDVDPDLSEQFVISCNPYGYDCIQRMWWNIGDWVMEDGIPDEDCFPYVGTNLPCSLRCSDWQERAVKITDWGVCPQNDTAIKQEITNGPISAGITIKEDFFYYQNGIYKPVMGEKMSFYGVICAGWNSSGAWLCKNLDYFANWFYVQVIEHPTWMV